MLLAGAVSAASAASYGHRTTAPSTTADLSGYALQPPEEGEEGEAQDSTSFEPPFQEPGPISVPSVPPPPPGIFGLPDTSTRRDSLPGFPNTSSAPVETIGPRTLVPAVPPPGAAGQQSTPERTLFGLSPLALVAGLIALHIIVVSVVVK